MSHLGLLNGRSPAESNALVVSAFSSADTDKDNALNLQEFTSYFNLATAPRTVDVLKAEHPEDMIALRQAFVNWASFGSGNRTSGAGSSSNSGSSSRVQLGSAHWLKICRDTGLVGRGALNPTDADLIFAKVKPRGLSKINFGHFVDALGAVASRLNKDLLVIVRQVTTSQGPLVNNNQNTSARLSNGQLPTGQQQQGRRSSAPRPPSSHNQSHSRPGSAKDKFELLLDTSNNKNESKTDSFSIPAHRSDSSSQGGGGGRGSSAGGRSSSCNEEFSTSGTDKSQCLSGNIEQVLQVFSEFAGFGSHMGLTTQGKQTPPARLSPMKMEMDSKQFLKLCKDSGLVTNPATSVAADLCFAKAKARGSRRLAFSDFLVALALFAQEKKCPEGEVLAQVAACKGPRRNSTTIPEFTRLHDDKETYTGVYARGGPKTLDSGAADLATLLSREQGRQI
jgi:hypothetical protein